MIDNVLITEDFSVGAQSKDFGNSGPILLQGHVSAVRFRNVRIKELPIPDGQQDSLVARVPPPIAEATDMNPQSATAVPADADHRLVAGRCRRFAQGQIECAVAGSMERRWKFLEEYHGKPVAKVRDYWEPIAVMIGFLVLLSVATVVVLRRQDTL